MSRSHPIATSSSNFPPILENALKAYERRTKKAHPLDGKLQACDSPGSILVLFQQQIQAFNSYESGFFFIDPFDILQKYFRLLGRLGHLRYKNIRPDLDDLDDIFKLIEAFLQRLEIYSKVSLIQELVDTIMEILVEALCILSIVTKEVNHFRMQKRINKALGISNIGDALKKLNKLTQKEARMAPAQALRVTRTFEDGVRRVTDKVVGISDTVAGVDDMVASVDEKLRRVTDNVFGIDDRVVARVDDRLTGINDTVTSVDDRAEGRRRRNRGR